MKVKIEVGYNYEDKERDILYINFEDLKKFRKFAKRVQKLISKNKWLSLGNYDEIITIRTEDIECIYYDVIEK